MKRQKVYEAIDTERDYQEELFGGTKSAGGVSDFIPMERTLDEYALYIGRYGTKLINDAGGTRPDGTWASPEELKDTIRKIAALCVACGESHGMPVREVLEHLMT